MMSMRLAAGLVLCLSGGAPAVAQTPQLGGMVTGNDIQRVMQLAEAYGPVERNQDANGTWLRGEMDGLVYSISFLDCNDQLVNCTSVQFRAFWESDNRVTLDHVNTWNRDWRFAEAYLDSNNNATIEWDVNLAGGVTAVNFDDSLQWWRTVLMQFRDEVIDPQFAEAPAAGVATK